MTIPAMELRKARDPLEFIKSFLLRSIVSLVFPSGSFLNPSQFRCSRLTSPMLFFFSYVALTSPVNHDIVRSLFSLCPWPLAPSHRLGKVHILGLLPAAVTSAAVSNGFRFLALLGIYR